jgi:hypothetical protein
MPNCSLEIFLPEMIFGHKLENKHHSFGNGLQENPRTLGAAELSVWVLPWGETR